MMHGPIEGSPWTWNKCSVMTQTTDCMETTKAIVPPSISEAIVADRTFSALGVKGVSIQDIDTAHRVPSMKPSNRPNAILCKFVRRLAKDKVMAARKKVVTSRPKNLDLQLISMSSILISMIT